MTSPVFLFVSNAKYFHLLLLAIRSLIDFHNPREILVFDIGLTPYQRAVISRTSSKTHILRSGRRHSTTVNQDRGWVKAVGEKTEILRSLVETRQYFPLVLADSDLVFLGDLTSEIDGKFPIQVTRRSRQQTRPDGNVLDYIASFLVINDEKAIPFLDEWINRMSLLEKSVEPPFESLAQHQVTKEFLASGAVGELEEDIVACDRGYVQGATRAIHLKSMGPSNHREVLLSRLRKVRNLPIDVDALAAKYLGWRFYLLRARAVLRRTSNKGIKWLFAETWRLLRKL